MNKNKILIFTVILFILINITGCIQDSENKKYELLEYSVETRAYSFNTGWEKWEGLNSDLMPVIADHDPPYFADEFSKGLYVINGTVKNTGNVLVPSFIVTMDFYDENNTFLFSKQINNFSRFDPGEIWEFKYEFKHNDSKYQQYFYNVYNLTIYSGIQSKNLSIIN